MKCVVLLVVVFFSLAIASPQVKLAGFKGQVCPVGTHVYMPNCEPTIPEATCSNPNPVLDTMAVCSYFESLNCYCDEPTVRDEKTNQCVAVDKCS